MPQRLKRRSEAISRNTSETENDNDPQPSRQRQRQRQHRDSSPPSETASAAPGPAPSTSEHDHSEISDEDTSHDAQTQHKTMVKKLVRLALSAEYSRQPIRRTDINAKILKSGTGTGSGRNAFRTIFTSAQETLRDVFGMEMVDLPSRERTGIADRRKAASQKATQRETQASRVRDRDEETQSQKGKVPILSAQSWILVSTLPTPYRVHPTLLVPARAPNVPTESAYTALYTLVVSLIYLHAPSGSSSVQEGGTQNKSETAAEDTTEPLSDAKLHRWLSRLDLDSHVPAPVDMALEKMLGRMIKEGYVERRRDTSSGEEVEEWVVGPRGKKEIGRTGIAKLVRGVYGFGVDGTGKGLQLPSDTMAEEQEDEEEQQGEDSRRRGRVKMERDELERRLQRTLGAVVKMDIRAQHDDRGAGPNGVEDDGEQEGDQIEEPESSRRGAREVSSRATTGRSARQQPRNDDEEDEDDE